MTLSSAEIGLIVDEIAPMTGRARIQRVLEADRHTRILQLRVPGQTHHLLISTKPELTRIHFVDDRPDQPDHPSAFTMQLRKWLGGARLDGVDQLNEDRVVRLALAAVDPEWEPSSRSPEQGQHARAPRIDMSLILELTGRHPNWYLLDAEQRVIARLDTDAIGDRSLEPGRAYRAPPAPPDPTVGATVRLELDRQAPSTLARSARLADHYRRTRRQRQRRELRQQLERRLKRRRTRLVRRIDHVKDDLDRADNADQFRRYGELLQSAWGKVEPGATSVDVPDFYDDAMPSVDVPLEPSLSLEQNIEQYFHEYHRLSDAHSTIEARLSTSIDQRDAVDAARSRLSELGPDLGELKVFGQQLLDDGILAEPTTPANPTDDDGPRRVFRQFRSKHGRPILVGRGAADNDTLTTSIARGRDVWLHARDWPGAHVVLRMRKDDDGPNSDDLVDAATLAAWFCRGNNDSLVDVTYTRAKYVRKPKGMAPGRVTTADASTIGIVFEQTRLDRLLDSEQ